MAELLNFYMCMSQQNQINNLRNENNNIREKQREKLYLLKSLYEEKDSQINDLNKEIKNLKNEKSNKINKLNNQIEQIKSSYENEKYQLNRKIDDLIYQKILTDDKNRSLQSQINNLQNKYNNIYSTNQYQYSQINQLKNDNSSIRSNYEYLKNEKNRLQSTINQLNSQNISIRNQFDNLKQKNNKLEKKMEEEEKRKLEEEERLEAFENTLQNDIKEIENKSLEESKKYILNFIINEYIKDFKDKNNKNNLNISIAKILSTFANNFVIQCKTFSDYYKSETIKLIQNYKVNESNIKVEHINFIVIGQTGVGKSTFINESLLLEGNKRAAEGKGLPITDKSRLYCSEKLDMLRMWDTMGVNYEISQQYILKEIKRLVAEGLTKGIDNYINIILYCIKDDRFQKEDAQLISEIMKIYPMDNLPVIITRLQSYFQNDSKEMEKIIREILTKFLDSEIVKKIEISSIVSRDKEQIKARGIPELLIKSVNLIGRAITSATFKKISQEIEKLCENKILRDNKINYLNLRIKNEIEVLEQIKFYNKEEEPDYFNIDSIKNNNLSQENFYNRVTDIDFYYNNFLNIISTVFLDIYNKLNGTNYSLNDNEQSQILKDSLKILNKIKNEMNNYANDNFEKKIFGKLFEKYYKELRKKQRERSREFNVNIQILEENELESDFKEILFKYFTDVLYKYYICCIIEFIGNNIKSNIVKNHQKLLNEDQSMIKIINENAENNLKFISKELKQKLMVKLNQYFKKLIIIIKNNK